MDDNRFQNDWVLWLLFGLTGMMLICSCSTSQPIVVERVRIDTLKTHVATHDTMIVRDSVLVREYMRGDTIYMSKEVIKWRERASAKTDTIYKVSLKTDTICVPTPVERKQSAWEKVQIQVGKFTLGVAFIALLSLLLWLIHRRK